MRKYLIMGIIALFILSSLSPFVVGHTSKDVEMDATLANLQYLCTTPAGFDQDKYEHYRGLYLDSFKYIDSIENIQNVIEPVEKTIDYDLPLPLSLGPMNSSWPMKCHDTHHTGRSQYSTTDNPYVELWTFQFDSINDNSPVISNDGTIYIGGCSDEYKYYLFAFNPNGIEKWRYQSNGLIKNTCPAIAEDGTIYFVSWDEYLYAINPNGNLKWRFHAGDVSISSSPTIAEDGTIYFGCMGPGNYGRVYAVNQNGTEKWHYDMGYWTLSDPAIGDDGEYQTQSATWEFTTELEPISDLDCNGNLHWTEIEPGATITGTITVENIGEPTSLLDWEIESYPEWANWTFIPDSGTDLLAGNSIIIDVEVIAPDVQEETFTGEVVLVNSENASDTCTIEVSLATPLVQPQGYQMIPRFMQIIIEKYPILGQLFNI